MSIVQRQKALISIWLYGSMLLWTVGFCLIMVIPCLMMLFFPAQRREAMFRRVIVLYGRTIIFGAVWPLLRVKYEDRAPTEKTPGIYIFNHRSSSDPFLVAALGVPLIQIVNGWPMKLPFFGYFARQGRYIDATKTEYEAARKHIRGLLKEGVSVVAFPEGTRSGNRKMNQFHSGIFRIALELNAPIYPCCIVGNEELPDLNFRFRSGVIRICRGHPVMPTNIAAANAFVLKTRIKALIATEIAEIESEKKL